MATGCLSLSFTVYKATSHELFIGEIISLSICILIVCLGVIEHGGAHEVTVKQTGWSSHVRGCSSRFGVSTS